MKIPPAGEIEIWSAALDRDSWVEICRPLLSDNEREHAERFRFEYLRRRYTIAHGFLRDLLGRYLGTPPEEIAFESGEHGKPFVPGTDLQFNLSHSENLAACAVTSGRSVGVDVEFVRTVPELDAIAARFFTVGERERIVRAEDRLRAFFECWTRKEAYIKGVGGGLSIPLTSFDASVAVKGWALADWMPEKGYAGAVALEGEITRLDLRTWQPGVR